MNGKKAKAIRRAMRNEKKSPPRMIFHPYMFENQLGERCVRYRVQYITTGGDRLVKVGKRIYDVSGILPKEDTNG